MSNQLQKYFATCPLYIESLLADELKSLKVDSIKQTVAGVYFSADLETVYRVCLWSRFGNHILYPIKTFNAPGPKELYDEIFKIDWQNHLTVSNTFVINSTVGSSNITNSQYASQVTKDAIADYFYSKNNKRPNVDKDKPDLRINVHIKNNEAVVSIDLSGDSLHMRGYRTKTDIATLKENVACALLIKGGWEKTAKQKGTLVDLMCGSGTILIEAAMIAGDIAPGLSRKRFGFEGWLGHNEKIWNKVKQEALDRKYIGFKNIPLLIGFDKDDRVVNLAKENIKKAGFEKYIKIIKSNIENFKYDTEDLIKGLVAINPPYGIRLGEKEKLKVLYKNLGLVLLDKFNGWNASVITGDEELSKSIELRPARINSLYNGGIKCTVSHFIISPEIKYGYQSKLFNESNEGNENLQKIKLNLEMFANRINKRLKELKKWLKRENISCYRIYDSDLPNYAVAIDFYENRWVNLQEYAPPKEIDPLKAEKRLKDVVSILPGLLKINPENIFLKTRKRQKDLIQYTKLQDNKNFEIIYENDLKFYVNFTDYLDTGIFLDHRIIRKKIMELAKGKHFLNLFSYTGTATVYAAKGGALTTTSVDKSRTYTEWAKRNLELNELYDEKKHYFYHEDCIEWLEKNKKKYDLIFLDPPTFSNTKDRMEFVLQRDHVILIKLAMKSLNNGGILIFSNNFRKFAFDYEKLNEYNIEDISKSTIPFDFTRNQKIHYCWVIK